MLTATDLPSSSRALVPIAAAARDAHPHRADPARLQLPRAVDRDRRKLPQTRERRRADPAEVIAAYRATVERLQKLNEKSE